VYGRIDFRNKEIECCLGQLKSQGAEIRVRRVCKLQKRQGNMGRAARAALADKVSGVVLKSKSWRDPLSGPHSAGTNYLFNWPTDCAIINTFTLQKWKEQISKRRVCVFVIYAWPN